MTIIQTLSSQLQQILAAAKLVSGSVDAVTNALGKLQQDRGFAVVAKEVGKLATESKKSIDSIRKTVQEVTRWFALCLRLTGANRIIFNGER